MAAYKNNLHLNGLQMWHKTGYYTLTLKPSPILFNFKTKCKIFTNCVLYLQDRLKEN